MSEMEVTPVELPQETTPSPESPTPPAQPDASNPPAAPEAPKPELSLREKIQAKAAEVAAKNPKDPATGKFLGKKDAEKPPGEVPKAGEKDPKEAPKTPENAAKPGESAPFTPNFKVKVDKEEREIPKILQPLMKDEASSKEIRELVEKAFGLEFNKPRLERATQMAQAATQEVQTFKAQIGHAASLYQKGDMEGFFKALNVQEEKVLQWVADKLEYSKLPVEQRQILDARKQAEQRAESAEQRIQQAQQENQSLLTQQVQIALKSCLARPDVDAVAKAYDARVGKPGAFEAEVNRRGDYIWRTTQKVTPPDQLVSELMGIVGPIAPPAAAPTSPTAPAAAPAAPAPKVPTIPNISGRSVSAVAQPVRSIQDLKNKQKELAAARQ